MSSQPKKDVSLIAVSKEMDLTKSLVLLLRRILTDEGSILLILSSLPLAELSHKASASGVDMVSSIERKKLVVVDCITRLGQQKETIGLPAAIYASSPADLQDVALRVSEGMALLSTKGERWLILDSITTLAIYNSSGGILRFMQYLLARLNILDFDGVMVVVRDEISDSMVQALKQYCSRIIFLAAGAPSYA